MNSPDTLPLAPTPAPVTELPLEFTGSGAAYFKIWIVNLLLSIVTVGIYSAWAKVRRERYFLNNTLLEGSPFEYHAQPINILKGRLLVVGVLIVANIAAEFNPLLNLAVTLLFFALLPWMISRAMRFRAHNTSWRGLRFAFHGGTWDAAKAWVLWPIAGVLTLGLLFPFAIAAQRRYLVNHLRFGTAPFEVELPTRAVYRIFIVVGVLVLALLAVCAALVFGPIAALGGGGMLTDAHKAAVSSSVVIAFVVFYLGVATIAPYVSVRLTNLVLNLTRLQDHGFLSQMRARRYVVIVLTNWLFTLLTLGLYRPFAVVRLWAYRVAHLSVLPAAPLDEFVTAQEAHVRVIGEEAADMLDIDLGF